MKLVRAKRFYSPVFVAAVFSIAAIMPGLLNAEISANEARSFLTGYLDTQRNARTTSVHNDITDVAAEYPLASKGTFEIVDVAMIGEMAALLLVEHEHQDAAIRLVYIVDNKGTNATTRIAGVVDEATYCMDDATSTICLDR